ncbi:MAG: hypothetical protein ACREID_05815, partial [Planctomycetota bacterium]
MPRAFGGALLFAAAALAADSYEELLRKAAVEAVSPQAGEPDGANLDRADDLLAEAIRVDPNRWQAHFHRGIVKCQKAVAIHRMLQDALDSQRASGVPEHLLDSQRKVGDDVIRVNVEEAYREFLVMERVFHSLGSPDPDRVIFGGACLKYARREYEKTRSGERGAIQDFEALVQRRFEPDLCRRLIALAYLDRGAEAFARTDYAAAQRYWDEGLKWAPSERLRELLRTNKAGAYELDNAFGSAEEVLRTQIELTPYSVANWKNLGLVLGFQGRLREALVAYGKARELCRVSRAPVFPGALHGNAWLRAASIHGKLLEEDGDVLEAWRLFLDYRRMLGDDYNFALAFGDFAFQLGEFEVAKRFVEHAKTLQPFCPQPYLLLVSVAARRSGGSAEERRARIDEATHERSEAQARFIARDESPALRRICSGLRDFADANSVPRATPLIEPDALAGFDAEHPPPWV